MVVVDRTALFFETPSPTPPYGGGALENAPRFT